MSLETFPFFDLPDVVIRKILREYLSMSDKRYVLSRISEFNQLFSMNSFWFSEASRNFYNLLSLTTPGYYIHKRSLKFRYYISFDAQNLTLTISQFENFSPVPSEPLGIIETKYSTRFMMISSLKKFRKFYKLINEEEEDDFLIYRYRYCCFSIQRSQNIVRWGNWKKTYLLSEDNECFIPYDRVTLILEADNTVIFKEGGYPSEVIYPFSSGRILATLKPITFQVRQNNALCHKSITHENCSVTFSDTDKDYVKVDIKQSKERLHWKIISWTFDEILRNSNNYSF